MLDVAFVVVGLLVAILLILIIPAVDLLRTLGGWWRELLADDECPKAAVILMLRGHDRLLTDCIEALLGWDYPRYDVRIVVDHDEDPAWDAVRPVLARREPTNVQVEVLRDRLGTCSLNCASLVQVIDGLDESFRVIAVCDADTVVHAEWLRELVTPLVRDGAGVSTGQRWYMPAVPSLGSLVRYVWNAATVVATAKNSVLGCSCAFTRECIAGAGLIDCWKTGMGQDAMVYPQARGHGFRVAFVPSVMIINR